MFTVPGKCGFARLHQAPKVEYWELCCLEGLLSSHLVVGTK